MMNGGMRVARPLSWRAANKKNRNRSTLRPYDILDPGVPFGVPFPEIYETQRASRAKKGGKQEKKREMLEAC